MARYLIQYCIKSLLHGLLFIINVVSWKLDYDKKLLNIINIWKKRLKYKLHLFKYCHRRLNFRIIRLIMAYLKIIQSERKFILRLSIYGAAAGFLYSILEYYFKGTSLLPLILRATVLSFLLFCSLGLFDLLSKNYLRKKSFFQILGIKSVIYFITVAFWLLLINGINEAVNNHVSFLDGMGIY